MSYKNFNKKAIQHYLRITRSKFFNLRGGCGNEPPVKLKVVKAPPIKPETYRRKNEILKRVLSPHLSIYKTQMSSFMSIFVRISGVVLGVMAWTVALIELISDQNVDYFVNEVKKLELDDWLLKTIKTIIIFPFSFHLVGGVRHLLFDTSKLLEKPQFFATGCIALALAFVVDFILGLMDVKADEVPETQVAAKKK